MSIYLKAAPFYLFTSEKYTRTERLHVTFFNFWRRGDHIENLLMLPTEVLVWFDFYFTALQHILDHFGRSQLPQPNCSWVSLLGSLPVFSAHSFASNWQLLFLNQQKREKGHRNVFMTKSPRKSVPDVGIELGAACMPSWHASNRATATRHTKKCVPCTKICDLLHFAKMNCFSVSILQLYQMEIC